MNIVVYSGEGYSMHPNVDAKADEPLEFGLKGVRAKYEKPLPTLKGPSYSIIRSTRSGVRYAVPTAELVEAAPEGFFGRIPDTRSSKGLVETGAAAGNLSGDPAVSLS